MIDRAFAGEGSDAGLALATPLFVSGDGGGASPPLSVPALSPGAMVCAYSPNAERDARIEAEGLYTGPDPAVYEVGRTRCTRF